MATKTQKTAKTPARPAAPAASAARPRLANPPQDLEQQIRDRAYFIYLKRGCEGCARQDWYEAERQVRQELGIR